MTHTNLLSRALSGCTLLACLAAAPGFAETPPVTYTVEDSFDNVAFAIESAIVGAGLVIDHVSHTGEMLERTRADVGSDKVLFGQADVFSFCSASVSRQVMEADLANIQHCPYGIFVYDTPDAPGTVTVGHRQYDGTMGPVNDLLTSIVKDALGTE
ncbi:DUF302 domain-containing protein [Pseudotabrizicola sp. L79]|uniref:DUF302 domain-containing protein n=1 Tax=Pseudotabrizicola sp. L79 TaxID=3118402 RepID=UPI002F91F0EE